MLSHKQDSRGRHTQRTTVLVSPSNIFAGKQVGCRQRKHAYLKCAENVKKFVQFALPKHNLQNPMVTEDGTDSLQQ